MNGVISISLKNEIYYHWVEVLFKSILDKTDIEFCLVYDNKDFFKKYNLDKIVKYPIYKTDIINPYLFKYELIDYTPFDNTIFFDADTIIFKDISDLFDKQFLSICAKWDDDWIYNDFSFISNPTEVVKKHNLNKFYSAYSGYIRFEKTNFYYNLFKKVLSNEHYDYKVFKKYARDFMPDEYFLNLSISNLDLKKHIPIKLYYLKSNDSIQDYYGYSFQGNFNLIDMELKENINKTLKKILVDMYLIGGTKFNSTKQFKNLEIINLPAKRII
jgi:hypothetical protein